MPNCIFFLLKQRLTCCVMRFNFAGTGKNLPTKVVIGLATSVRKTIKINRYHILFLFYLHMEESTKIIMYCDLSCAKSFKLTLILFFLFCKNF